MKIYSIIVTIIAVIAIYLLFKTPKSGELHTSIKTKIDTIFKYNDTIIYKDKLAYIHDTTTLPQIIDTVKVLDSFYAKNYYMDSIESNGSVVKIKDTVTQNRIVGRSYDLKIKETYIHRVDSITVEKVNNSNSLYIAPNYNLNTRTFGFQLNYNVKNKISIIGGYNNGLVLGAGIKLK